MAVVGGGTVRVTGRLRGMLSRVNRPQETMADEGCMRLALEDGRAKRERTKRMERKRRMETAAERRMRTSGLKREAIGRTLRDGTNIVDGRLLRTALAVLGNGEQLVTIHARLLTIYIIPHHVHLSHSRL
jgi:hypothetical protein